MSDSRRNLDGTIRLDLPSVESVLESIGLGDIGISKSSLQWREEIEEARKLGFSEGVEHARAKLLTELDAERERYASHLDLLGAAVASLRRVQSDQFSLDLNEIVAFALELTRKILRAELVLPARRIQEIVDEVSQSASHNQPFVIKVGTELREEIAREILPDLAERGVNATVVVDESLGDLDVVIESGARVIDASIERAFERVLAELGSWRGDS